MSQLLSRSKNNLLHELYFFLCLAFDEHTNEEGPCVATGTMGGMRMAVTVQIPVHGI